ncbi:Protein CBG25254 [Caenorhabditis briggsae]|uniref:Protein CBG25254 n=2 Tax=Caenorhabditis briggsae TaxID=6238 RepID=B6IFM4_CAEBR|nr:Protein CBG25254 [Caenorhabditis briggsae]ULU10434.1 hypothetical protein L3Y34_014610 [Caenorhabditis briggsae]CAR98704.1 Protein CBG25254 [Caenorhabditis briggsae]
MWLRRGKERQTEEKRKKKADFVADQINLEGPPTTTVILEEKSSKREKEDELWPNFMTRRRKAANGMEDNTTSNRVDNSPPTSNQILDNLL